MFEHWQTLNSAELGKDTWRSLRSIVEKAYVTDDPSILNQDTLSLLSDLKTFVYQYHPEEKQVLAEYKKRFLDLCSIEMQGLNNSGYIELAGYYCILFKLSSDWII